MRVCVRVCLRMCMRMCVCVSFSMHEPFPDRLSPLPPIPRHANKRQHMHLLLLIPTATEDQLHQPVRGSDAVMPALFPVIESAINSGAKGEQRFGVKA